MEDIEIIEKNSISITPSGIRGKIIEFEKRLGELPNAMFGDCFPLKHTFVDGAYVREITMPKGALLTSKIHKIKHPYFILKGEVSVLTENGIKRLKAPYSGITEAGTKRVLYIHEDTVWTTVHITNETDLEKIEKQIIAESYEEMGIIVDTKKEENSLVEFIKEISEKEQLCLG
jgi:hypothetical protein